MKKAFKILILIIFANSFAINSNLFGATDLPKEVVIESILTDILNTLKREENLATKIKDESTLKDQGFSLPKEVEEIISGIDKIDSYWTSEEKLTQEAQKGLLNIINPKDITKEDIIKEQQQLEQPRLKGNVGLINPGEQICFMNASLQSLFSLEKFNKMVLEQQYDDKSIAQNYFNLWLTYRDATVPIYAQYFASKMREIYKTQNEYLNEAGLKDLIGTPEGSAMYDNYLITTGLALNTTFNQEDAHEFIITLFRRMGSPVNLFSFKMREKIECSECKTTHTPSESPDLLTIELPITASSLQDCLKNYTEDVIDDYFCANCGKNVKAIKTSSFSNLPQYLAIQLLRHAFDPEKSELSKKLTDVSIPHLLDLQPHFIKEGRQTIFENAKYNLKAIILHSGTTLKHGHYIAWAQRKVNDQETGILFDDFLISPNFLPPLANITITNPLYEKYGVKATTLFTPYILFYERQEPTVADLKQKQDALNAEIETINKQKKDIETEFSAKAAALGVTFTPPTLPTTPPQSYFSQVKYLLEQLQIDLTLLSGITAQHRVEMVKYLCEKIKYQLETLRKVIDQIKLYVQVQILRKQIEIKEQEASS